MAHEPDPALRLLWRHHAPADATPRRGPKQRYSVDEVVDAAIGLADRHGLEQLTMRSLAQELGLGAMTLYTYVPARRDLVALMVDQALGRAPLPLMPDDLRERLELVARTQYAVFRSHPWLHDVAGIRPWLGPHAAARYEWQLSAVEGVGFDDIEMDQTIALLGGFAATVARSEHQVRQAERESGMTELEWWQANADELGAVMAGAQFPVASRVGQAAGEAYQAATDPARELEFGLARIVDGLLAHLAANDH